MQFVNSGPLLIAPLPHGNLVRRPNVTNVAHHRVNRFVKPVHSRLGYPMYRDEITVDFQRVHPYLVDDHSNGNEVQSDLY